MEKVTFVMFVKDPGADNIVGLVEKGIHEISENLLKIDNVLEFEDENEIIHYKIYDIQENKNLIEVSVEEIAKIAKIKRI